MKKITKPLDTTIEDFFDMIYKENPNLNEINIKDVRMSVLKKTLTMDLIIKEPKKEKIKYCCEDFKITKEDYNHITIKGEGENKIIRFSGHVIIYCPFCRRKL